MENRRRPEQKDQLEHHSLPGTNMAGKHAADHCEPSEQQGTSEVNPPRDQEKENASQQAGQRDHKGPGGN
jgi:hypothetical protein